LLQIYDGPNQQVMLKLCDFGLAAEVGPAPLYDICGTPSFMSPEMVRQSGLVYLLNSPVSFKARTYLSFYLIINMWLTNSYGRSCWAM
jgi:serine/threonine protein kinase